MFGTFRGRITQGYVLLALALIVVIVGATSALAFLLFSRSMDDLVAAASARAADRAARIMGAHGSLQDAAPQIVAALGRRALHVAVVDDRGRRLAQNEREGPPSPGRALVIQFGRAIGLPHERVPVRGGAILISADVDRFGELLLWYWSIVLPIGVVAVLVAWIAGRRITSRAIRPLAEVTDALRVIAAGDFAPQRLLGGRSDLQELTGAYNDVAHSLATATAERARTEAQMRQFIADAGHELRTPLTIIMGYLDALRKGIVHGTDATQQTYATMLDESRKMRALIDKLILLARLDRAPGAPLERFDLAGVARAAAESLGPLAAGRVHVEEVSAGLVVTANESELREAIKNAIDNALKYAPQADVAVIVSGDGTNACVDVVDKGPGMGPQDAAHAFDRFYRGESKGENEGTGLGLAIARSAIERAGGTVELESTRGIGTRVRFRLPRSESPPAAQ